MVREAVKQYAVDPDQFFTQSPLGPQADKLKDLAKEYKLVKYVTDKLIH